jgi:hypothetical protein
MEKIEGGGGTLDRLVLKRATTKRKLMCSLLQAMEYCRSFPKMWHNDLKNGEYSPAVIRTDSHKIISFAKRTHELSS